MGDSPAGVATPWLFGCLTVFAPGAHAARLLRAAAPRLIREGGRRCHPTYSFITPRVPGRSRGRAGQSNGPQDRGMPSYLARRLPLVVANRAKLASLPKDGDNSLHCGVGIQAVLAHSARRSDRENCMSIPVACVCGQRFLAQPHLAGQIVRCPVCGNGIGVPHAVAPQPVFPAVTPRQSAGYGRSTAPQRRSHANSGGAILLYLGIGGGVLAVLAVVAVVVAIVAAELSRPPGKGPKTTGGASAASGPGASQSQGVAITSEGASFCGPKGWKSVTPIKDAKMKACFISPDSSEADQKAMIVVSIAVPLQRDLQSEAQSRAMGWGGSVLPEKTDLDGEPALRIQVNPRSAECDPVGGLVTFRYGRVYFIAAAAIRGRSVQNEIEEIRQNWKWVNEDGAAGSPDVPDLPPVANAPAGWEHYKSGAGGYSALMPLQTLVRAAGQTSPRPPIKVIEQTWRVDEGAGHSSSVMVLDLPIVSLGEQRQKVLDDFAKQTVSATGGRGEQRETLTLSGRPALGVRFKATAFGKPYAIRAVFCEVRGRLYTLMWYAPTDDADSAGDTFFDSFRIDPGVQSTAMAQGLSGASGS